jgi:G3E family GTPase
MLMPHPQVYDIRSVVFQARRPFHPARLAAWLGPALASCLTTAAAAVHPPKQPPAAGHPAGPGPHCRHDHAHLHSDLAGHEQKVDSQKPSCQSVTHNQGANEGASRGQDTAAAAGSAPTLSSLAPGLLRSKGFIWMDSHPGVSGSQC